MLESLIDRLNPRDWSEPESENASYAGLFPPCPTVEERAYKYFTRVLTCTHDEAMEMMCEEEQHRRKERARDEYCGEHAGILAYKPSGFARMEQRSMGSEISYRPLTGPHHPHYRLPLDPPSGPSPARPPPSRPIGCS